MIICFHGTTKENIKRILRRGFQQGTYFARHLEDALEFGGPYVFFVRFDDEELEKSKDWWQFYTAEEIPASKICKVVEYSQLLIHDNPKVVE